MSFNAKFDQHGAWRREFALHLKLLAEWMKDHDLLDAAVEERLHRLESQVRSDKVMVAFSAVSFSQVGSFFSSGVAIR